MIHNKPHFVFVYGTLKQGHRNEHVMQQARPDFIGLAHSCEPSFDIIVQASDSSIGKFTPGAFVKALPVQGFHIEGELYCVDEQGLAILDELEQVGVYYNRERHNFRVNQQVINAWIYIRIDLSEHVTDTSPYVAYNNKGLRVKWR